MKDYSEAVKGLTIPEAIHIAMDAKKTFAEDADKAIAALLKLEAVNNNIAAPLTTMKDEMVKMAKKQALNIEGSAVIKIYNPVEHSSEEKKLNINIGPHDVIKTDTDFKAVQADNGIDIITEAADAAGQQTALGIAQQALIGAGYGAIAASLQGLIVADNVDALKLFKNPTIPGNPTAFAQKLAADSSFSKYQTTKTDKKYEMGVSLTPVSEN